MTNEGWWQLCAAPVPLKLGGDTSGEGPRPTFEAESLSTCRLAVFFDRKKKNARKKGRAAKEGQAIWRACGGQMLPHCVDMSVEAWLHRMQWTRSCNWNHRTPQWQCLLSEWQLWQVACAQCLRRPLHHSSPFEAGHTAQDWARACLEASELTWREVRDMLRRGRLREYHLQVQQSVLGRSLGHAEPHVHAKGAF